LNRANGPGEAAGFLANLNVFIPALAVSIVLLGGPLSIVMAAISIPLAMLARSFGVEFSSGFGNWSMLAASSPSN
jgi:hypothetical protein